MSNTTTTTLLCFAVLDWRGRLHADVQMLLLMGAGLLFAGGRSDIVAVRLRLALVETRAGDGLQVTRY